MLINKLVGEAKYTSYTTIPLTNNDLFSKNLLLYLCLHDFVGGIAPLLNRYFADLYLAPFYFLVKI